MIGVNKVILVGALGKEPETRHTQGGKPVTNLRVATSESRKDSSGEWTEYTEWHTVVLWGHESLVSKLAKGSKVYIEGRLQTRKWQDKTGQNRYSTEVVGWTVILLGDRNRDVGGDGGWEKDPSAGGSDEDGDEIPF